MCIINEPNVTDNDINQYFSNCYIIDPHSGRPARTVRVNRNRVDLELYDGYFARANVVSYDGNRALPFFDLGTYKTPSLGWRDAELAGGRVVMWHASRRVRRDNGVRGCNSNRITVRSVYDFAPVAVTGRLGDAATTHSILANMCAPKEGVPVAVAVKRTLEKGGCVINSNAALVLSDADQTKYYVFVERAVVGHGDATSITLNDLRFAKLMGDTRGIAIRSE